MTNLPVWFGGCTFSSNRLFKISYSILRNLCMCQLSAIFCCVVIKLSFQESQWSLLKHQLAIARNSPVNSWRFQTNTYPWFQGSQYIKSGWLKKCHSKKVLDKRENLLLLCSVLTRYDCVTPNELERTHLWNAY